MCRRHGDTQEPCYLCHQEENPAPEPRLEVRELQDIRYKDPERQRELEDRREKFYGYRWEPAPDSKTIWI